MIDILKKRAACAAAAGVALLFSATLASAQHGEHHPPERERTREEHAGHGERAGEADDARQMEQAGQPQPGHGTHDAHQMFSTGLGGGWSLMGMAQVFPTFTIGAPGEDEPLSGTGLYATQPAIMFNIESPGSRVSLRTTLNFEGWTQPDGELTYGGWGEGFIDKRHPHTLLHEAMLSVNLWEAGDVSASLSAGKGFAPYGTDDPMSRPAVKYPTNHHLSQILERWTLNGVFLWRGWSVEAGLFGGAEPTGPYDLSNIESFGDSWSLRTAQRFGEGFGSGAEWEVSTSYGRVREEHHQEETITILRNVALRHDGARSWGRLYGLVEISDSRVDGDDDEKYFSILGETRAAIGAHSPYLRLEYATRPEYAREAGDFFRYDHDSHAIGATRWLIPVMGYGYTVTGYPLSVRPYAEAQYNRVWDERGGMDPLAVLGADRFWSFSVGARLFLGGDPMRMGSYGVLDPMSTMARGMGAMKGMQDEHAGHMMH